MAKPNANKGHYCIGDAHMLQPHSPQERPPLCCPPLTSCVLRLHVFSEQLPSTFTWLLECLHILPHKRAWFVHPVVPALLSSTERCTEQWELGKSKARCRHSPLQKIFLVRGQRRAMCRNSGLPVIYLKASQVF